MLEDGVLQFFQKHKIGMALIADCKKRIEEGQAQLQEELYVCKLRQSLQEVKDFEKEMTGDAVSDVVLTFWKIKTGKNENKLMSKHKSAVQMIYKEFWATVAAGIHNMLCSSFCSCVELLLEHVVIATTGKLGTLSEADMRKMEAELDLEDVFRAMRNEGLTKHEFWQTAGSEMPKSMQEEFQKYAQACEAASGLMQFVLALRKAPGIRAPEPTTDTLNAWRNCAGELSHFLDCLHDSCGFNELFVMPVEEEFQRRAIAAFHEVGKTVGTCTAAVSDLEKMACCLAQVKDDSVLGKDGPWTLVLPAFVQAQPSCDFPVTSLAMSMVHGPFLFWVRVDVGVQVATTTVRASKKEAPLYDVLVAAEAQNSCLQASKAAASKAKAGNETSTERFDATKLGSSEFQNWLSQLGAKLAERIFQKASAAREGLRKVEAKGKQLLQKMPAFVLSEEAEYRKSMAELHNAFAATGAELRGNCKELRRAHDVLKTLASQAPPDNGVLATQDAPQEWLTVAESSQKLGQCLVTHLTLYAMVTLLRSPTMGSKSEAGKKLAKNLQDLLRTFLEKDFLVTPLHSQLPPDSAEKLCKDCREAAGASGCCFCCKYTESYPS